MLQRKICDWALILSFMVMLLIPLLFMNIEKNQVSGIDNRKLTELEPFEGFNWTSLSDMAHNFRAFFNDRLGFRSALISFNMLYKDKLFNLLDHPSYEYGRDGHIYFKFHREWNGYKEFNDSYTDYIRRMQAYCEERNVDFLYALNPSKTALYREYLPDGIHYQFGLYDDLLANLEKKGVNYIDLAEPLLDAKEAGFPVCDVKYDAGHWNMHGAFYGMSAIMERLRVHSPVLSSLNPKDFDLTYKTETSLALGRFPIDEDCPHYTPKISNAIVVNGFSAEIRLGRDFPYFTHYINPNNPNAPKILVFHGSHLGAEVQRYITDQFSEAVFIYSYNIIADFPYYFNLFGPDIVLYEVADRTIDNNWVNIPSFENKELQPPLLNFIGLPEVELYSVKEEFATVNSDEDEARRLKELKFSVTGGNLKYAYMRIDDKTLDFDVMELEEGGYSLSITVDNLWIRGGERIAIVLIPENRSSQQVVVM